jgi:hypothetical protein
MKPPPDCAGAGGCAGACGAGGVDFVAAGRLENPLVGVDDLLDDDLLPMG